VFIELISVWLLQCWFRDSLHKFVALSIYRLAFIEREISAYCNFPRSKLIKVSLSLCFEGPVVDSV